MKTFFTFRQIYLSKASQRNFCLSLFMFVLLLGNSGYAQNIYQFTDNSTGTPFLVNANATGGSLTRGTGLNNTALTCTGSTNGFGAKSLSTLSAGSLPSADAAGDFISFTITPNAGYRLNITGFSAFLKSPSTPTGGPTTARYSYKIGSGALVESGAISPTTLGTSTTCSNDGLQRDWLSFPAIITTQSVTFKIYGFNADVSGAGELYLKNVVVAGLVECDPTIAAIISPTTPTVCANSTVTLTGSKSGGDVPALINHSWAIVSGGTGTGSLSSPTTNIANLFTGLTGGTVNVQYTLSYGACSYVSPTKVVTVNGLPTITLGANPKACLGEASTSLTYSATSNSPNVYTINYDPAANTAGFVDVSNQALTASPISIPTAGIAAGTYNATLMVENNITGCTSQIYNFTVTVNALPTATASSNSPICSATALNLTGGGGTTYAWTGPNTFTATGAAPSVPSATTAASGVYSVTVTDANGCTATATTSVTVNALPTATASSNTPICAGATLNLSGSGGISYAWTGANSFTATGASPSISSATTAASGVYTVTVTDANNCTAMATTSVTVNALPTATASSNTPVCAGATLTLNGGGGTTYAWAGPNSFTATGASPSITSVTTAASGVYTVMVTNVNNCTAMATTSVTVNTLPTATASSNTPICAGTTLNFTGSGGITYAWTGVNSFAAAGASPSISSATIAASGVYTVTVTDANNCTAMATTSATVNALPTATANSNSPICAGTTLNLSGGGTGTYAWAGPNSFTATGASPSISSATTAASGVYTVIVTNTNNCTAMTTTSVTVNALPTATASSNTPVCAGATLTLSGTGAGAGTYAWTGANSFTATGASPSILSATTAASGVYMVSITDINNCTAMATTSATVNPLPTIYTVSVSGNGYICSGTSPTITLSGSEIGVSYRLKSGSTVFPTTSGTGSALTFTPPSSTSATYTIEAINTTTNCVVLMSGSVSTIVALKPTISLVSKNNVSCNGGSNGSITVSASVGSGNYSYTLAPSTTNTTGIFNGLPMGTYSISVTDVTTGCMSASPLSVIITEPTVLTASTTKVDVLCKGAATGTATVTPGGGTSPYTYAWTGAASYTSNTATATLLSAGSYNVIVTDAKGCTAISSATIIEPTSAVAVITAKTDVLCKGGSTGTVTATPSGGTGAYTYSWTGPSSFTSTSAAPTGLLAGIYNVTVKDANSCMVTGTVTVGEPTVALTVAVTATNVLCFGGSTGAAMATPAGGTPAYTYAWTGPSTFTSTSATLTGLVTGTYNVTVTDANSCTVTGTVIVGQPTAVLTVVATKTDVLCNGGSTGTVTATIAGGTPAYSYAWSGPSSYTSTMATPTGLSTGSYSVTVTDSKGCTATSSATVSQPSSSVSVVTSKTDVLCKGASTGAVTATASGGTPPYTYAWTGPSSFTSTSAAPTGLLAGGYTVTVRDGNSCMVTSLVTIGEPTAALTVGITKTDVLCKGGSTGTITATPAGGTGAYTYAWTRPSSFTSTLANPTSLLAGAYNITVMDANSCTVTGSVMVGEPTATLTLGVTATDVLCFGGATGKVKATPAGGTPAFTYAWTGPSSFTSTMAAPMGLPIGTYDVTITDANSCMVTGSVTVGQPIALTVVITATNVLCFGGSTGKTLATPAGGTSPYTYAWTGPSSFTSTVAAPMGLLAGTYNVTVMDANSCTVTGSVMVTQPTSATTITASSNSPICEGLALNLTSTPTSATGGLSYAWSGPDSYTATTQNASISATTQASAGVYTATVTDGNSCVASTTTSVIINTLPTIYNVTGGGPICSGVVPTILLSGSQVGTNYKLLTSSFVFAPSVVAGTGSPLSFMPPATPGGTYTIEATNTTTLCKATMSGSVSTVVSTNPTVSIAAGATILNCTTLSTTLTASGSAATYSWTSTGTFSSTSATPSINAPGTYTVTATEINGCTATANVVIAEDKVAPTVGITPTTAIILTCANPTASLTATGAGTYSWTSTGTFTATTAIVTINAGSTYTVTGISTANGCSATANLIVTENKTTPTITFSPTTFVLTCANPTTSITASGADSYSWTSTGGFTATTATATINTIGIYTVIGTNTTNGCTAMATIEITENKVTPTITVLPTTAILTCANPTATITASGGNTYSWTKAGGGFTSTTNAATINTAGIYTVVGTTTANGCTAMATVQVTENKVTPTISVTPTTAILTCTNPTTTITASGGDTYSWTGPNSFTATTDMPTINTAGIYTVVGTTTANGCTAMATVQITENKVTPTITITGNVPLCSGTSTINLTATGGGTYQWAGPNSFTSTSAAVSIPNATVLNAGVYTVIVTNANGCTAMATENVLINPVVTVPTVQALASIPTGGSVTLAGSCPAGTLSWYDAVTNGPVTMPVSPTVTTTYYARCAVTANSITCMSANSAIATVNVGDIVISIVSGGAWNNPATWDVARVPLATDKVIIDTNHNIIITDLNAKAKRLEYRTNAKVTFGNPATKLTIQGL